MATLKITLLRRDFGTVQDGSGESHFNYYLRELCVPDDLIDDIDEIELEVADTLYDRR